MRHLAQFLKPFFRVFALLIGPEAWRAQSVMHDSSIWIRVIFTYKMIIFNRQFTHVSCPFELVEVHCRCFADVFRRQASYRHAVTIENH